jgi:putative spermidine/putrescine transport system ATP-binding protein
LDLKLRKQMQLELKRIQQEVGITFIYVTHDQEEALAMSDRMAIFDRGRIEQVGSPAEVYERPSTAFVAGFVGTSNILSGASAEAILGQSGTFTVRPEKIRLEEAGTVVPEGCAFADGRVQDVVYLGSETRYHIELAAGGSLAVIAQNVAVSSTEALAQQGRAVRLVWERRFALPLAPDDTGGHTEAGGAS